MKDLRVNEQPMLPKQRGTCQDSHFLGALLVQLNMTFAEYGQSINDHEERIQRNQLLSWMDM